MIINIYILIERNPYFESSASSNRWQALIDGLITEGARITILVTNGYGSNTEKIKLGVKGYFKGFEYVYLSTNLLDTLWKRRFDIYIGTYLTQRNSIKKIIEISHNQPNAIYWTSSSKLGFKIGYLLKKENPKLKTILEMSEFLDIHKFNLGNKMHKIKGDKRKLFFEKRAIYTYDVIFLMTKTLINHYKGFTKFKGKLVHLPMTVDIDRFSYNSPALDGFESPYLAFVGVMNNKKDGVNILIEAFSQLPKKFSNLKLYLIGPWNYDTPSHIKRIKELKLTDNIKYIGQLDRDQIPNVVSNAKALVLPRPDSKQAQGGFPTKLGEYLASGRPVVCTRVGEIPNYLKDKESVYFAKPGSVKSLKMALEDLLSDPSQSINIGRAGKEVAINNFNKHIQSKILYNSLKNLNYDK